MSSIKLESNASGTGIFTIASPNSNTNRTLTLPDATGTIITTAGGAAISGTTGTFTGLVDISAAGAGQIQFPATQNASSNANTLDDYEEGSWTPVVAFSGASVGVTYSLQVGRYTKIGNQVTVWGSIALSNKGSSAGSVQITGIPFTSDSTTMYPCMGVNTFSLNANKNTIMQLAGSSTNLDLKEGGTDSNLSNTDFANSTQVRFIFTYRT